MRVIVGIAVFAFLLGLMGAMYLEAPRGPRWGPDVALDFAPSGQAMPEAAGVRDAPDENLKSALGPKASASVLRLDDAAPGIPSVEPVIAASPDGKLIAALWMEYRDAAFRLRAAFSADGGETFEYADLSPASNIGTRGIDPMAVYDPHHDRLLIGGLNRLFVQNDRTAFVYQLDRDGVLSQPVDLLIDSSLDKGHLAVVPGLDPVRILAAFRNHRFYSDDGGMSWESLEADVLQGRVQGFGSQLGLVAGWRPGVSDENGFIADNDIVVRASVDGGLTYATEEVIPWRTGFTSRADSDEIPGDFQAPRFPAMAVDQRQSADGERFLDAVLAWPEGAVDNPPDLDLRLFRRDQGEWNEIEEPLGIGNQGDQFFPMLQPGPDGDLHLVWFDTRNGSALDDDPEALLDVYYAYSFDGGFSWMESRMTDTFSSVSARYGSNQHFMGDYLGLAPTQEEVLAVYPAAPDDDMNLYLARIERELDVSGHWFSLAESGHGFAVERLSMAEGERLLVYWFHYDDDGAPIWLVALGNFDGRTAVLEAVTVSGDEFPPNFDPDSAENIPWGSLTMTFAGDGTATVSWQNSSGVATDRTLDLVRATRIRRDVLGCRGGAFYDPARPGHGIILEFVEQGRALLTWYAYHLGRPFWIQAVVLVDDPDELVFDMNALTGSSLDDYDPNAIEVTPWGEVTLERLNGDRWRIRWQPEAPFESGQRVLQRLTSMAGHVCP